MSRKNEKFNKRQNLILLKAEELIKKEGYNNFTMDEIAKIVDIAKGTLYLHFKSKEELVFNLVQPKMLELLRDIEKIEKQNIDFFHKFNNVISSLYSSSFFQFVVLCFPDMSAVFKEDNEKQLETIQKNILDLFITLIDEGKEKNILHDQTPSQFAALQLMQVLDPLIYNYLVLNGNINHDNIIRYTSEHLINGMKKQ